MISHYYYKAQLSLSLQYYPSIIQVEWAFSDAFPWHAQTEELTFKAQDLLLQTLNKVFFLFFLLNFAKTITMGGAQSSEQAQYGFHVLKVRGKFCFVINCARTNQNYARLSL